MLPDSRTYFIVQSKCIILFLVKCANLFLWLMNEWKHLWPQGTLGISVVLSLDNVKWLHVNCRLMTGCNKFTLFVTWVYNLHKEVLLLWWILFVLPFWHFIWHIIYIYIDISNHCLSKFVFFEWRNGILFG